MSATDNLTTEAAPKRGVLSNPDEPRPGLVLLYARELHRYRTAYVFGKKEFTIGRDMDCDLCIPDRSVSRKHALISQNDDGWVLRDLGGRNGTIVNGRTLTSTTLEHLDEIRIGDVFLKFVDDQADRYSRFLLDGSIVGESPDQRLERLTAQSELIGGYQLHEIIATATRIAESDISVLISGETGTGKENLARYIHKKSGASGAFVAVNCGAISPQLVESELFGHRKGAFSGAIRDHIGLVRAANKGTLFLDEIGDMPLEAQTKLLRVLQRKEVLAVGDTEATSVEIRVVSASHRNLPDLAKTERFRGDLFARLNGFGISLPPLRERKEDIYMLCQNWLSASGRSGIELDVSFVAALLQYSYPFNIRELETGIRRAVTLSTKSAPELRHLPPELQNEMADYGKPANGSIPRQRPSRAEEQAPPTRSPPSAEELRDALRRNSGNVLAVAREFGKRPFQIYRWMSQNGISADDFR